MAKKEGKNIKDYVNLPGKSLHFCKRKCKYNGKCNSFTYCINAKKNSTYNCHLKDKILAENESTELTGSCTSYAKTTCQGILHKNYMNEHLEMVPNLI